MQTGVLDGIADGEIHGWAFDTSSPDAPLKISVHWNGRVVTEALAGYYRLDVARHFQTSGRHGFFIDVTRIPVISGEGLLDVKLPNGKSLSNSPLQAAISPKALKDSPTLIFFHIPKTAGTSLREAVQRNYRQSEIVYLYTQEPGFPIHSLTDLPLEQRARCRLLVGHWAHYGMHGHIPNECLYFTVVRDPVSRVWSNYQHLIQAPDPRVLGGLKADNLEEMFATKGRSDLDNLMVRYFSGEFARPFGSIDREAYDLARHNLREHFPFVGTQENVTAAYTWLKERFGWDYGGALAHHNRTDYAGPTICSESDRRLIQQFNEWDLKLYEDVLAQNRGS